MGDSFNSYWGIWNCIPQWKTHSCGGLSTSESRDRIYYTQILVLDNDSQQWTAPYPLMPVGQRQMGCASYLHYLIIAGGNTSEKFKLIASVDTLETKSEQWFKAPPMPYSGSLIWSVIPGNWDKLILNFFLLKSQHLVSASKHLLRISLPILISHTLEGKNDTSIWRRCQMCHSTRQLYSLSATCYWRPEVLITL